MLFELDTVKTQLTKNYYLFFTINLPFHFLEKNLTKTYLFC